MQSRIIPVLMKTMLVKTNASYYYLVANYLYGQQLLSLANFIIVIQIVLMQHFMQKFFFLKENIYFQETIVPSKHVTNSVSETHTKGVYHKNKIKGVGGGFERQLPSRPSRLLSKIHNLVEWICRPSTFINSCL